MYTEINRFLLYVKPGQGQAQYFTSLRISQCRRPVKPRSFDAGSLDAAVRALI
jgi:hypothetical protein